MKVQVVRKDGTVRELLVRYSPQTKRLFTTMRVLEVAGVKPEELIESSASFDIYRKDWQSSGICEDDAYHNAVNRVASVPYVARCWNYL